MAETMHEILEKLADGATLSADQARHAVSAIMDGASSPVEIAAFLTAIRVRGETEDELVGAARAMRARLAPLQANPQDLLDTCGTGGDASGTFNVSTAVAIVASACGVPVAKHGNRSVSSTSGSADVLRELGVNLDAPPELVRRCLDAIGLAFFFAPHWHPAMKHAMPVRRELRFRTIFNLLGPLSNPAGATRQLVGVARREWADKLAQALLRLGARSATVVCGTDGLDEVTLAGETYAVCVREGRIETQTWSPEAFGLPTWPRDSWRIGSAAESAAVVRGVLSGEKGAARDLVLANAAAALWTADKAADLRAGVARAAGAIDSAAARRKLDELVRLSNS